MTASRRRPIHATLGLKFVAVAVAFLVAGGTFVYLHFPMRYEATAIAALTREMEHLAGVIGATLAPALDFDDPIEVATRLAGLDRVP
jgi:hypothetical protein